LALLERKPGALDHALPLDKWELAHSGEIGRPFRSKSATHSGAKKASRFGSEATLVV
jgi:hypothetical protein